MGAGAPWPPPPPPLATLMVRSEFAYYVPRTSSRTVLQFNFWGVSYHRNVPVPHYKKGVPCFLAKIEAYRQPSLLLTTRNFNWLWNHLPKNQRSQFTHLMSASAVFCLCQGCGSGSWKRLIFCGSGSTLMGEVGSGSELGSESVEKELEAEAIFSKSGASEFSNSETGYNSWGKM